MGSNQPEIVMLLVGSAQLELNLVQALAKPKRLTSRFNVIVAHA